MTSTSLTEMAAPSSVADYAVFPVALPATSAQPGVQATHYMYARAHKPNTPDAATPRSMFLANVPPDSTAARLRRLVGPGLDLPAGRVRAVYFEDGRRETGPATQGADEDVDGKAATAAAETEKSTGPTGAKAKTKKRKRPTVADAEADEAAALRSMTDAQLPATWDRTLHRSGSGAVVEFVDRESMRGALEAVAEVARGKRAVPAWHETSKNDEPKLGRQRYAAHHRLMFPPRQDLLRSVDLYMTAFAEREAARVRADARRRNEPDADGFVTVTRGGRTGAARAEDAARVLEKQRAKRPGFEDFYRFQARDRMKHRAGELVRRFEEDKERIRKMREQRGKFRPE